MSKHEFPYSYPLSDKDYAEIRHKANRERNEAIAGLLRSARAAVARLLPRPGGEPAHPTTTCTTTAR